MNYLGKEVSPYLLQHADNPVDWFPWGQEAFDKAKAENKPIFLSIGYSTCHWCHVMAHESFEDTDVAELLNKYFVAIKVDKEERPDIDSIYMSFCQAFTGSGGWPMSIFMTPEQKPFFAATYLPRSSEHGMLGMLQLLNVIHKKWNTDKQSLVSSAENITDILNKQMSQETTSSNSVKSGSLHDTADELIKQAVSSYIQSFDSKYGGFGSAPKFPAAHNLMFLMNIYSHNNDERLMKMVQKTLLQMYCGGLFDHIGYGFSRYSTDEFFLVPHFEKMLYDNALLIMSYCQMYSLSGDALYRDIAIKCADYILREMTGPDGAFYSAQDADSEGHEGMYYVFTPGEIINVLGQEQGSKFNEYYNITDKGNFHGKSIPNILGSSGCVNPFADIIKGVYEYRRGRYKLHLDDKILTSWNALMITAMTWLYRISGNKQYIEVTKKAQKFIEDNLCDSMTLFVSFRENRTGKIGFLDDYAYYVMSLISLYEATFDKTYLDKANVFCREAVNRFYDSENGGFYLYGKENEQLVIRSKDTYDGAMPSGNSVMAYNLVRMSFITDDSYYVQISEQHLSFLANQAVQYPQGSSMFLSALSDYVNPHASVTIVRANDNSKGIIEEYELADLRFRFGTFIKLLDSHNDKYPLINDKTTFYVCRDHSCLPPTNKVDSELLMK